MRMLPMKLGTKLMVWIALTFLAIFALVTYLFLRMEMRKTFQWVEIEAHVISKTVQKSMEQSMIQGDMKAIQGIIQHVVRDTDVKRMRVVNDKGLITRSSELRELGTSGADAPIQEAIRTSSKVQAMLTDAREYRVLNPLINVGACIDCHQNFPVNAVLGVLDITLSIEDKMNYLSQTRRLLLLTGMGMVLIICLVLFFLLHRKVLRHLSTLSRAATLMAEGNSNISVAIPSGDEIGFLGEAFNRMVVTINDANEKNTSLIRGIADPLLTVNNDMLITYVNGPMVALSGYPAAEVVGKLTCRDILRCDQCAGGCHLQRIVQGKGEGGSSQRTITSRNGVAIPVVTSDSILMDSKGNTTGAMSIMRDITLLKEAERKLANEVSWSSSVIQAIADPIFTVDPQKNITFINDAAVALTGFSAAEAMGQKCSRIFRGEICRQNCIYDQCLSSEESLHSVDRSIFTKDGREIQAQASGAVLRMADGKAVGCLEIVRDVTEEKRHVANLVDILKHVQEASETITAMAGEILANSDEQKKSVSEQSSSVKEVATTIEELDITSQQTSEKAETVVQTANRTVKISEDGQKAVEENLQVMNAIRNRVESIAEQILELSQQAQQIGSIITAVSDLAEQTNLLALNAAIEAARAGEHGRGFTVVAMEVKKLAEQSQAATSKISTLINEIQQATKICVRVTEEGAHGVEEGVKLAATAGETIQKVANNITNNADAVQQIATIAKQQSVGIQQVSMAMANINSGMNQTTQSAHRLSEAAERFSRLAARLNELTRKYKL
jgi:PAS domain S-box-containing protein